MAKADTIATQLAAIQQGEQQVLSGALGQAFDDGAASIPAGGITSAQEQTDIAAAVAAATQAANDQITALQLAKTQEDAVLATVKALSAQIESALNPAPAQS